MKIGMTDWLEAGVPTDTIVRQYQIYSENTEPQRGVVEIRCAIRKGFVSITTHLAFYIEPPIVWEECILTGTVGTVDNEISTGSFEMRAGVVESKGNLLLIAGKEQAEKSLSILCSGRDLYLRVIDDENKVLFELPFANDNEFRLIYERCRKQFPSDDEVFDSFRNGT